MAAALPHTAARLRADAPTMDPAYKATMVPTAVRIGAAISAATIVGYSDHCLHMDPCTQGWPTSDDHAPCTMHHARAML